MPDSITLLHLSDVQFGRFHRFPENSTEENPLDSLAERVVLDLAELQRNSDVRPDILVLTGDIAEWGKKNEFAAAAQFVRRIADAIELPMTRVAIVPGNHDINRKACEAYFNKCEADDTAPAKPYWPKWEYFKKFFDDLYRDVDVRFTIDQPWTLYEFPELKTVIAGFNSTMAESHQDDDHYGWVGEPQLRWFAEHLGRYAGDGWLRIGALHHNVRRGPVSDDENLRDEGLFKSIVGPVMNLVLHGHTHDGKSDVLRANVPIYSTGSAAVKAEARPPEVPNQYQLLCITRDGVKRWARAYLSGEDRRCFGGDVRASEDGGSWIVEDAVAFDRIDSVFPPARSTSHETLIDHFTKTPVVDIYERMSAKDDFLTRVERVCQLHHGGAADIQQFRNAADPLPYLSVSVRDGAFLKQYPIGVVNGAPRGPLLWSFAQSIHARYRSADPGVRSLLVYSGTETIAEDALKQAHRLGINVQS